MPGPDLEQAARIIAENVASAFESAEKSKVFQTGEREMVVAGLMRELFFVLPADEDTLVKACNRYIAIMAEVGINGPRVATVDVEDGSVTMR